MMFKPVSDNIVVRPDRKFWKDVDRPRYDENDQRIVYPYESGVVVAGGPGEMAHNGQMIPVPARPGQKVYFDASDGTPFDFGGETFCMVSTYGVVGVEWPNLPE